MSRRTDVLNKYPSPRVCPPQIGPSVRSLARTGSAATVSCKLGLSGINQSGPDKRGSGIFTIRGARRWREREEITKRAAV